MQEKKRVSFITVNYNGFNDTCELIHSIYKNIFSVDYEIIVVDNASRKNEATEILGLFPYITCIRSEDNLGFAGGNNLGIKEAKGDYLFFINNDTYFTEDKLSFLITRIESSNNVMGVSPKIKDAIPPYNLQFAGFTALNPLTIRNKIIGLGCTDEQTFNIPCSTPYLHGAAMFIKREAIQETGFMPEVYFLYYEELDWSVIFTRKGYELWYEPQCTIFHKESQSTGKQSKLRQYYITRNRLLFAWRNNKGFNKWLSILYQIFIAAPKNICLFIIKSHTELAIATMQGIRGFILLTDKMK